MLQEKEFERLGGVEPIQTDVRLVAATNCDLEQAITDKRFREDLYYRLNVFTIFVPPLRERRTDILLLADHFLEKYARDHGRSIKRISTPAIDMLMAYHWPGNVRELQNVMERAVLVCDASVVHGHHLPPTLQTSEASGTVTTRSLSRAVQAYEKDLIQGRPQDRPWQPHQGRQAARLHAAHHRLQGPQVRHRLPALPHLTQIRQFCSSWLPGDRNVGRRPAAQGRTCGAATFPSATSEIQRFCLSASTTTNAPHWNNPRIPGLFRNSASLPQLAHTLHICGHRHCHRGGGHETDHSHHQTPHAG